MIYPSDDLNIDNKSLKYLPMKSELKYYLAIALTIAVASASILDILVGTPKVTVERVAKWGLSMKVAMFQKPIAGGGVQCLLCPFRCVRNEGERGICGVRAVVKDTLRALTFARPSAINIDPIEKKPLFHFLPGTKSYSIATVGCNLSCKFCQNWTLSQTRPEDTKAEYLPPEKVVELTLKNRAETISYTYSEPTVFYEYMLETSKLAHEKGIKNLWITCGYINPAPLRELAKYLDAANVDIKGWDDIFYAEYIRATRQPVLETCKILKEMGVWLEITNLIIPGANDDPKKIREMCKWIKDSLGADVPVHFSRFHPNYKLTDRPATPVATLDNAYKIAKEVGLKYVYVGNVPGDTHEDTYCPNCRKNIIDRTGYWINSIHIKKGACEYCGQKISGKW